MPFVRQALSLFLLLVLLAQVLPLVAGSDNGKADDAANQSDRPDDQQNDPVTFSDLIFEHCSILRKTFAFEILAAPVAETAVQPVPIPVPRQSLLPSHIVFSACGLMPRAPALG